jgi:phospholipid/cholesterol/gamma-HCH transport system substrate-binding protein
VSLKLAIQRYARWAAIIVVIWIIAIACAGYILAQQRLKSPFAESYEIQAEFENLTGVAPGLGLPVNVAGVRVGQITGVKVRDGLAVATMRMDPHKLEHVYRDAGATLIPNTLLKDMRINLRPGTPRAGVLGKDQAIPASRTKSPIDLDELLAALDSDTRSWFTGLMADLGVGLHDRGRDIRKLLRALGPTTEQVREIGDLLAARRHTLPKLVHDLSVVSQTAGSRDRQLATVVARGNQTVAALARQETALRSALARLPGTLDLAGGTLERSTKLTDELGPTLAALTPTARRLPQTLRDSQTLFRSGALLPIKELRQFITAAQPLTKTVPPTVRDLSKQIPPLTDAFKVLDYTVNELAYNPGGANKSFLYWIGWFAHNANSVLSTGDANGTVTRGMVIGNCATFTQPGPAGDILKLLLGSTAPCPTGGGG